jgi:hypothetical protein
MTMPTDEMKKLAERVAFALSSGKAREAIKSILGGEDDWRFEPHEAHRTRPYPMGFYDNDHNIYWAIGWGHHDYTFPWERWILRRLVRTRAAGEVE